MQVAAGSGSLDTLDCSAVVVLASARQQAPAGSQPRDGLAALNTDARQFIEKLIDRGELSTELAKTAVLYGVPGMAAHCLLVVGGGDPATFGAGQAYRAAGAATKRLADQPRQQVALSFGEQPPPVLVAAIAGSLNGCQGQDLFRSSRSLSPPESLLWMQVDAASLNKGIKIGEAVYLTRELVNLPPNRMYPEEFARRAAHVAVASGLELEVWDELRLRRERCDSLLGVSAGSSRPPRLLILRYPGTKSQAPLALVGKGVTFDSGGLSLKPSDGMLNMKCDMAGAATVLGAMQAIAQLRLAAPVVGLVGLVENMVSGSSYKLGDVLQARNGKTIEIHNTDAEGRLVLADVLNVALEERPQRLVDLATLTGACVVALGLDIAGLMSNHASFQAELQAAAQAVGEEVWPLPMSPHFSEQIRSKVADIKNVGEGRWGGAITAAKFLEEFVDGHPWVHIDIAGPAFADAPKTHIDAGASGVMVRTLVELVERM